MKEWKKITGPRHLIRWIAESCVAPRARVSCRTGRLPGKSKEGFLGQSDGHFGIPFSCPHLLSFCMKVIVYARRHRLMAGFLILGRAWRGFDPSRTPVFKNDTQSLEWASTKIYDCSACVCVRVGTCMLVRGTLFPGTYLPSTRR